MRRKLLKYAALMLCACLVLSGCNLIRTNPEYLAQQEAMKLAADNAIVLASYAGGSVTKGEVSQYVQDDVNIEGEYMSFMYSMYGITSGYSMTADDMNRIKEEAIQAQAKREILSSKLSELGLEAVDEEAIRANAVAEYADYSQSYISMGAPSKDVARYLMIDGITESALFRNELDKQLKQRLLDATTNETTVDEAEVQTAYQTLLNAQRDEYSTTPASAESAANAGTAIYYIPEGYKYVKHILVIPEDTTVMSKVSSLATEIDALEADIDSLSEQAAQATEGEADISAQLADKKAELEAKTAEHAAAVDAAWAAMKTELDEIKQKIDAGEDFDALIKEYTDDPGSLESPISENGYLVYNQSSNWVSEFLSAVNALDAVGDISEPVMSSYGAHIIKYDSAPTVGEVPFDAVSEIVKEKALTDKKEAEYAAIVDGWLADAEIVYSYDNWKIK